MSQQRKPTAPKPPTYAGNALLRDWTRTYDNCLRQLAEDEPTDGHPALRRAGRAASKQNRGRE